ncbi:hypothetical protein B9Z55_007717 [Caenorhabditis nigoni]|uniref:BTB domain-containing protein n=1 Tax=Caenorhabditis nigoni TaxID=1611254 RepID=A0A2G5VB74_9PELO|nr:hypothetical protein B9Z55_007717 [Caenorhabditis nigoni]
MASNGEDSIGKEQESTVVLGNLQVIELVKKAVAEEIQKANKHNVDELSDRLQAIEASISKISKSNDAEKTKNDSKKELNGESTVPHNNTTKVPSKTVKRFQLKHVFKDVANFKEDEKYYSEWEEHYNVKWRMSVKRYYNHLGVYVHCEPIAPADNWTIRPYLEFKVVGPNQNDVIRTWQSCIDREVGYGFYDFLDWEHMKTWFLVDGKLTVEVEVKINETSGLEKPKIRKFDESQKDISDVILVVMDTKFYVSKTYLASQSDVFKALLFGNSKESKQSEVTLNGIDPDDFHYFLEVLYGEFVINDSNVEDIALLADMYDAPTVLRRCEEFLLEKSKKTLEKKLEIATQYNLENLRVKYRSHITTTVVPKNNSGPENRKVTRKNSLRKLLCF